MSNTGGFRKYLFAGDAGIAQATQVPSMANAGDGKVLSIKSNIYTYNTWQEVVLDDNVYEVYRAEILPTINQWDKVSLSDAQNAQLGFLKAYEYANSVRRGVTTFSFELFGMTQMKRIFMEYVRSVVSLYKPKIPTWINAAIRNRFYRQGLGEYVISDLVQPEFMMLDVIDRVTFTIGKNKLTFETGDMELLASRKVHMAALNYTPAEREKIAHLGLAYAKNMTNFAPVQNVFPAHSVNQTAGPHKNFQPLTGDFNDVNGTYQWCSGALYTGKSFDKYAQIFDQFFEESQKYMQASVNPLINNTNQWGTPRQNNYNCVLPLYCIIPFLAQSDTYLPKGVPIEITIYWNVYYGSNYIDNMWWLNTMTTNPTPIPDPGVTTPYTTALLDNFGPLARSYAGLPNQTNAFVAPYVVEYGEQNSIQQSIRLVYDYYVLKENIQKEFNLTWTRKPMLFNYFHWQRFDTIDKLNSQGVISYNLMINQQRPLALFLRFEIPPNKPVRNGSIQSYEDASLALKSRVYEGYQAIRHTDNNTDFFISKSMPCYNYHKGSAAGNAITFVEVYIGSQLVYKADTKQDIQTKTLNSVHSVLDSIQPNYRDSSSYYETKNQQSYSLVDNACAYKIDLSQNKTYERGMFSLDRGNTNMSITVKTAETIDTDRYTLAMYAMYPSQITLDKSYDACESKWPVIIAQNGPVVEPQYNIN